jgi:hypothetical protein
MKRFIILFVLSNNLLLHGQTISGTVFEMNTGIPVEYVNIGIVGKNIGTVSDQNGMYTLTFHPDNYNDTLRFSSIGYHPYTVNVSDFLKQNNGNVSLETRVYGLTEVVVRPKKMRQKVLGITSKASRMSFPLISGLEAGIQIKNKNIAHIKEVHCRIADFSCDSILFRITFYKIRLEKENIAAPIYVSLSKQEIKDKIVFDFRHLGIVAEGDFLVTIANLNTSGSGGIFVCVSPNLSNKHYRRRLWDENWMSESAGLSISVLVDVEK